MVVDDNATIRRTLRALLERRGHEVVLASDGGDAMRQWRRSPADLVITDVHMPDKNGLETVVEIRDHSPDVPIIVMSGGDLNPSVDVFGDVMLLGASFT